MTGLHFEEIFPYEQPNPIQKQIIQKIIGNTNNYALMIEAETGSGKTLATLVGLLLSRSRDERIVIFVKTINQINSFLKEGIAIFQHSFALKNCRHGTRPLVLPLLGKRILCKTGHLTTKKTILSCENHSIRSLPKNLQQKRFKKLNNRNRRFRLLKYINTALSQSQPTITKFMEIMHSLENCPSLNTWSMLSDADVIITTYGFFNHKQLNRITQGLNSPISKLSIIIDEAHNLAKPHFHTLKKNRIEVFLRLFLQDPFLQQLSDEIRGVRFLDKIDGLSLMEIQNQSYRVLDILKMAQQIVIDNPTKVQEAVNGKLSGEAVLQVIKDLSHFFHNIGQGVLMCSFESISIANAFPDRIFKRLLKSKRVLLQSATLLPIEHYRKLFGLPNNTKMLKLNEYDLRKIHANPKQFRACYISSLTSTSRFRNTKLFERYTEFIRKIFEHSPSHILVLCPSYEFIDHLRLSIETAKTDKEIPCSLVVETAESSSKDLVDLVIQAKRKTIILGNQNGKILEGNEWTRNGRSIVNTAVLAGLSTKVPRAEEELIYRHRTRLFNNNHVASLFANQLPLYIMAKQALGRSMRHPQDRGALIILDNRIDPFLHRSLALSRFIKFDELITKYADFVEEF